MKIAIDLNGGDKAPEEILNGAFVFSENYPDTKLIFCVAEGSITQEMISAINNHNFDLKLFHDRIGMKETPIQSKKEKPDNTISGAMRLLKDNSADCVLSCGNSGAVILNAIDILGLKDQKINPSLISFIPRLNNQPMAIFDVGALGNHIFAADLYFSILKEASEVYTKLYSVKNPLIRQINIGGESWKGTTEHRKLFQLLSESSYNFGGNIEGDDLIFTNTDIVITGGFTGNIILKILESIGDNFGKFRNFKDFKTDDNYLNFLMENFNYEYMGGAPLLGVNGKVVIGHGKSSSKAVESALKLCVNYALI